MKHKIGFIGLGLIGGSIAKAIRQYYPQLPLTIIFKIVTIYSYAHRSHIIQPI